MLTRDGTGSDGTSRDGAGDDVRADGSASHRDSEGASQRAPASEERTERGAVSNAEALRAEPVGQDLAPPAVPISRSGGRVPRQRKSEAVQEPLFDVRQRPERRYFRQMLDVMSRIGLGANALDAELAISSLFGIIWSGADGPRDGVLEENFGLGLVDYARQRRVPASVALVRTLAQVAPIREVREAADRAAAVLLAVGLPEPAWTPPLSALKAGRCWAHEDVYGDGTTMVCEFVYGTDRHAVAVQVDHNRSSAAIDALLVDDVDGLIRDLRNEARMSRSLVVLRLADPAWARALLQRAIVRTDLIAGVQPEPEFARLRALILARLGALPDDPGSLPAGLRSPSPAEVEATINDFLASAAGRRLPDRSAAAMVAGRIVEHALAHDPDRLLRVSPGKWESFLAWLPKQSPVEAEIAHSPAVIEAWTLWAGGSLPDLARNELTFAVEELLGGSDRPVS